ncbi:hypothetical protein WJX74_008931 [Apatococcus lobatus]|uniref:RAP domain-containing protein n=1 Tax=Apatococcus lobatus TaxID=904363 RepID=A0AAW1SH30_9CHLO
MPLGVLTYSPASLQGTRPVQPDFLRDLRPCSFQEQLQHVTELRSHTTFAAGWQSQAALHRGTTFLCAQQGNGREPSDSSLSGEELFQTLLSEPGSKPLPGPQIRQPGPATASRLKTAAEYPLSKASGGGLPPGGTSEHQVEAGRHGIVSKASANQDVSSAVANLLSSSTLPAEARNELLEQIKAKQHNGRNPRNQFVSRNIKDKAHATVSKFRKASTSLAESEAEGSQRSNAQPPSQQGLHKPKRARLMASSSEAPSAANDSSPAQRPHSPKSSINSSNAPPDTNAERKLRDKNDGVDRPEASEFVSRLSMTPEWEAAAAAEPGFFAKQLREAGILLESGAPNPAVAPPEDSNSKHRYVINHLMTDSTKASTILHVYRDVGYLFSVVNLATALNQYAKATSTELGTRRGGRAVRAHASLGPIYERLLAHVEAEILEKHMEPRQLTNIIWGLASLGETYKTSGMYSLIAKQIQEVQHELKLEETINTLWALAWASADQKSMFHETLEFFAKRAIATEMADYPARTVSTFIWTFAHLNYRDSRILQVAAGRLAEVCSDMSTQSVANTIWAMGTLGFYHKRALAALSEQVKEHIDKFRGMEISSLLVGLSKLAYIDHELMEVLDHACATHPDMKAGHIQMMVNSLWSFTSLRWYPERSLQRLLDALYKSVSRMKSVELCNTLWACARLGHHPGEAMLSAMDTRIQQLLDENKLVHPSGAPTCIWSLTVLQAVSLPCYQRLADWMASQTLDSLQMQGLHTLSQALLTAKLESAGSPLAMAPSIQDLVLMLRRKLTSITKMSGSHRSMAVILIAMGIWHASEAVVEDGQFSVDIKLLGNAEKVAIEFDGPYHFTVNLQQPMGSTLLRRRTMRALGWTLISVPFYHWHSLLTVPDKAAYLYVILEKAGVMPARATPAQMQAMAQQLADLSPEAPGVPPIEEHLSSLGMNAAAPEPVESIINPPLHHWETARRTLEQPASVTFRGLLLNTDEADDRSEDFPSLDLDGTEDSLQPASRAASRTLIHAPVPKQNGQPRVSWQDIPDNLADLAAAAARSAVAHKSRRKQKSSSLQHSRQKFGQSGKARAVLSGRLPEGAGQEAATSHVAEFVSSILNQKVALQPNSLESLRGSTAHSAQFAEPPALSSSPADSEDQDEEAQDESGEYQDAAQLNGRASSAVDATVSDDGLNVVLKGKAKDSPRIGMISHAGSSRASAAASAESSARTRSRDGVSRVLGEPDFGSISSVAPADAVWSATGAFLHPESATPSSKEPDHVVASPVEAGTLHRSSPAQADSPDSSDPEPAQEASLHGGSPATQAARATILPQAHVSIDLSHSIPALNHQCYRARPVLISMYQLSCMAVTGDIPPLCVAFNRMEATTVDLCSSEAAEVLTLSESTATWRSSKRAAGEICIQGQYHSQAFSGSPPPSESSLLIRSLMSKLPSNGQGLSWIANQGPNELLLIPGLQTASITAASAGDTDALAYLRFTAQQFAAMGSHNQTQLDKVSTAGSKVSARKLKKFWELPELQNNEELRRVYLARREYTIELLKSAAQEGQIAALQWLQALCHRTWLDHEGLMRAAARHGHLSTLQYLRSGPNPAPWDEGVLLAAAGHADCLEWLLSQQIPCPRPNELVIEVAETGNMQGPQELLHLLRPSALVSSSCIGSKQGHQTSLQCSLHQRIRIPKMTTSTPYQTTVWSSRDDQEAADAPQATCNRTTDGIAGFLALGQCQICLQPA